MTYSIKNLIYVNKCEPSGSIKDKDGNEKNLFKVFRSLNGFAIEPEYKTVQVAEGFYYPVPFTRKMKLVNYKGETYEATVTTARIGDKYEFTI